MSNHTIQSITIDMLRLPLAIMVIFIHLSPDVVCILDYQYPIFTGAGVLNFIEILCSKVISHIAVPTFFFISGLLFFIDFGAWSWRKYKAKIGNRLKTILLPYFLWNIVSFLLVALAILFSDIRYGGG